MRKFDGKIHIMVGLIIYAEKLSVGDILMLKSLKGFY